MAVVSASFHYGSLGSTHIKLFVNNQQWELPVTESAKCSARTDCIGQLVFRINRLPTELSGVGSPTSFVVLYGDLKQTQECACVYVMELTQNCAFLTCRYTLLMICLHGLISLMPSSYLQDTEGLLYILSCL